MMLQYRNNAPNKLALLSLAMLILCLPLLATFVQPQQAEYVAKAWLKNGPAALNVTPVISEVNVYQNGSLSMAQREYSADAKNLPMLYMIFTSDGQFVVVAADDNSVPVLGYSTELRTKPKTMSPEFAWLMDQYQTQIQDIVSNGTVLPENQAMWSEMLSGAYVFQSRTDRAVSPLLDTTWDQAWPYNELCPLNSNGPGGRVYAGCVATAMGQVMKYWNYPTTGVGYHSYTDPTAAGEDPSYGVQSANFGATTYLWDQMPNSIGSSNIPIATLLKHAGVSVDMNYDTDGSGAYSVDVAPAMQEYFRYPDTLYRSKQSFSEANWITMMKQQLDNGVPVYYGGSGSDGGHAWVMDGYDASNMFHMNFGWSGSYNGNFLLNAINSGNGSFNDGQSAVINTIPQNYTIGTAKLKMSLNAVATVGTYFTVNVATPPVLGSWNVNHYEFQLTYDNTNIVYNGFSTTGTMSAGGTVTVNEVTPGYLNVSWTGTTPLLGPGSLINFNFTPYDAGEYLFDMAEMKYNTTALGQTEYIWVTVNAPVAALAQSTISMTNVINLQQNAIGTTDMRTTYLLPSWNVRSYQFNVTYVPTKLEWVGVETVGTLSAAGTPTVVVNSPGSVSISFTSTTPITGEGSLLKLKFKAIGNTSSLSITQVTPSNFVYNTTAITAASGCTFRLAAASSAEDELAIPAPKFQVYPNPFKGSTAFKFNSVSNEPASFEVYNVKGQIIRQLNVSEGKAAEIVWDGKDAKGNNVSAGIYLVRWQQADNSGNAKILILK